MKKSHYCHAEICKGRTMDDQDLRVTYTYIDGLGKRWCTITCGWCGHRWETSVKADGLPGYQQAEQTRADRNDPPILHTGYGRF